MTRRQRQRPGHLPFGAHAVARNRLSSGDPARPMRSLRLLTVLLAVVACAWPGETAAAVRLAVEVHEGSSLGRGFLERVRSAGVDALAVDPGRVGPARLAEVRRAARRAS